MAGGSTVTAVSRNNDTAAFFLTRIPKRENQFGETRLCHFGVPFGLRLSIQHFLAFIPLSRSCTSSWSIVGSVQTSIWLSYVYGISVGMKYMSFKVFGYDILMHLIVKATFPALGIV